MFDLAVAGGQPGANFFGIVVEGTVATAVSDFAFFIEDVEALGPGCVGVVSGVVHIVDAEGNGKLEALGEIVGDGQAIGKIARLSVADVILEVGFHLPLVGGVSFTNIDSQKISVVLVVVEELDDVADLATEGRSSKAAEDEDERFAGGAFANVESFRAAEGKEFGVGSGVADFKVAAMHVGQSVTNHVESIFRTAGHDGKADEGDDEQSAEGDDDPHGDFFHPEILTSATFKNASQNACHLNRPCRRSSGRLQ